MISIQGPVYDESTMSSIASIEDPRDVEDGDWVPPPSPPPTVTMENLPILKNLGAMPNVARAMVRYGMGAESTAKFVQAYEVDRFVNN